MLGTMILTLFGTAGNCQVVLSANTGVASSPKGDWLAQAFGWACGSSILFFHRTSDQERRHRSWFGCVGRWQCYQGPHKPRSTLPFLAIVVLQLRTHVQVTVCCAIFRGFPWRKVPGYVLGQLIGAWVGAIIVFGNYFHAIDIVEGGKGRRTLKTGSLFATYAVSNTPPPSRVSHLTRCAVRLHAFSKLLL